MNVIAKLTAIKSTSDWTNHGTLGSNLGEGVQCSKVMNKGNGNFCLIKNGKEVYSLPVSKKANVGDSARYLDLMESPDGTLVLGTGTTEWE